MTETLGIVIMFVALFVSLLPFLPGPALVWAVGAVYAVATDFEHITPLALLLMTILMILGSTTEFWLKGLGMKTRGASCWGTLGSFFGGLLGTFLIPIPLLGTLIGAVVGALLIEFMRLGDMQKAYHAGRSALEMFILGMIVEFCISGVIVGVFLASMWIMR